MTREASPLPDQTRREFLAAAGALASTSCEVREARAGDTAFGSEPASVAASIPPHRPLVVEGIHAYTDRLSLLYQYLEGLRGHAVCSDLARNQEIDRQQWLRQ